MSPQKRLPRPSLPLLVAGALLVALAGPAAADPGSGARQTSFDGVLAWSPHRASRVTSPASTATSTARASKTVRAAASDQCAALNAATTRLRDRTVVGWQTTWAPGSGTITVNRLAPGVPARAVAQAPVAAAQAVDPHVSPALQTRYSLTVPFSTGAQECRFEGDAGMYPGVFEGPGRGIPDTVTATSWGDELVVQSDVPGAVLSDTGGGDTPTYSHDGAWLAYTRPNPAGGGDLVVRRADGTGGEQVVDAAGENYAAEPAYSHDGRSLVWTSYATGEDPDDAYADGVGILDLDSGVAREVPVPGGADVPERSTFLADNRTLVGILRPEGQDVGQLVRIDSVTGATSPYGPSDVTDVWVSHQGMVLATRLDHAGVPWLVAVRDDGSQVVVHRGAVGTAFLNPRLTEDRGSYFFTLLTDDDPAVPDNPPRSSVWRKTAGAAPAQTYVGWAVGHGQKDPVAFDVRQASPKTTSDLTGDGYEDLVAKDSNGTLWLYPHSTDPARPLSAGRRSLGSGWGAYDLVLSVGDWTGDGQGDLAAREPSGRLWLYPGDGAGGLRPRISLGGGWNQYVPAFAGDWNGDTKPDLVARDGTGTLWLYPGKGTVNAPGAGMFHPRQALATGWNPYDVILGIGDGDYDNAPDLLTRNRSTGLLQMWHAAGNARGSFTGVTTVHPGTFKGLRQIVAPERFVGAATSILGITPAGDLVAASFTPAGRLDWPGSLRTVGSGASPYRWQG